MLLRVVQTVPRMSLGLRHPVHSPGRVQGGRARVVAAAEVAEELERSVALRRRPRVDMTYVKRHDLTVPATALHRGHERKN